MTFALLAPASTLSPSEITGVRHLASEGDVAAQVRLDRWIMEGKIAGAHPADAVTWFRHAAVLGSAEGRHELGLALYTGRGVPKDAGQAVALFRQAADAGYPPAGEFVASV